MGWGVGGRAGGRGEATNGGAGACLGRLRDLGVASRLSLCEASSVDIWAIPPFSMIYIFGDLEKIRAKYIFFSAGSVGGYLLYANR